MMLVKAMLIITVILAAPATNQAQVVPSGQATILHLASGWNLIAGTASGVDLDATFYTLNDEGTDYLAVSEDQLQDFKGYWVYVDQPTDVTAHYSLTPDEPFHTLSCRSDRAFPCSPKPSTAKAIPVPHERWSLIGNSTPQPLKFAIIFYDVILPSGARSTAGYFIRVYDPHTASYDLAPSLLANGARVSFMLQPGQGAWILSPLDYVFLERIATAP